MTLSNDISTPADTLLLGEVISDQSVTAPDNDRHDSFHLPPPSPRHNGIALTEPTQWEKFADSIVKEKSRRGGGVGSAFATTAAVPTEESNSNATEKNIEL